MSEFNGTKLEAAKQAARFMLQTTPDGDELALVTFNQDADCQGPA
jgi:hypothetical protein